MSDIGIVEILIGLLILLNCFITVQLLVDGYLSRIQKFLQVLVVWLVPLFGALTIYLVRRSERDPRGPREPPFGGGDNDGMPGGVQPP